MRKVTVELTVKLVINIDEGTELSDVIDELEYDFTSTVDSANVIDSEIEGFDIRDSK